MIIARSANSFVKGFTLVELVVVIILLGILSIAAFPRFVDNDTFQELLLKDAVLSTARLSQKVALSHQAKTLFWRLHRKGSSLWQLCVYSSGTSAASASNPCDDSSVLEYIELEASGSVSYRMNGAADTTIATSSGISLRYDDIGFLSGVGIDAAASTANTKPFQINMPDATLCVSPAGYAYESSC